MAMNPGTRRLRRRDFIPSIVAIALFGIIVLYGQCTRLLADDQIVIGSVRVQLLSDSLARLELKGAEGFEDRNTFHIANRNWSGTRFTTETNATEVVIHTTHYVVRVPQNAQSLDGVRVESAAGATLYKYDAGLTNSAWLPAPSDKPQVWSFADTPRIIPPPWGLTPAPANASHPQTSGWDLGNDAPDLYVFVPEGSYFQLRRDFLRLTGPTEMPPLFAFGAFDSRWHGYSEEEALKQIDDYRAHHIPLDVLVVDTGWRMDASTGYQPNPELFPDMGRFLKEAHDKNVHVMFNDHPEPKATSALEPLELNYRYDGLTGLLNEGLDVWWYDRNWDVSLLSPSPNLRPEAWGMKLYHDITERYRPDSRPLIMANLDGVDTGIRNHPMDVAAHRFPIQWTGDIGSGYDYLRHAVENVVHSGVHSLFPYENDDLGGFANDPPPQRYIRWIEYGSLSAIFRPHCTLDHERMPWMFGPQAEEVARRFENMRYRLLPVFYAAAHENFETGEPLLRRLDLDYPQFSEARRDDEYLLGKDILIAPVLQDFSQVIPETWLKTPDGQPGLMAEYFRDQGLSGPPVLTRTDRDVDVNWGEDGPGSKVPAVNFSVRWTGFIEVPAILGNVILSMAEEDGARVWIDDKQVIGASGPNNSTVTTGTRKIAAGQHRLRIEYQHIEGQALVQFQWERSNIADPRVLWVPPGNWINVWTGEIVGGPIEITNMTPLEQEPIFIKSGAVLPLAPEMEYTGERPWNPITLDVYPNNETGSATLYEDDTRSIGYRRGEFLNTSIATSADDAARTVRVQIGAAEGGFKGALIKRTWMLRIHPPANWPKDLSPSQITIAGKTSDVPIQRRPRAEDAMPFGNTIGAPDGDVFELTLPEAEVAKAIHVEVSFRKMNH